MTETPVDLNFTGRPERGPSASRAHCHGTVHQAGPKLLCGFGDLWLPKRASCRLLPGEVSVNGSTEA